MPNRGKGQIPTPPSSFPYFQTCEMPPFLGESAGGGTLPSSKFSRLLGPTSLSGPCKFHRRPLQTRSRVGVRSNRCRSLDPKSQRQQFYSGRKASIKPGSLFPWRFFPPRFCNFDLSHSRGPLTRIVAVAPCTCS